MSNAGISARKENPIGLRTKTQRDVRKEGKKKAKTLPTGTQKSRFRTRAIAQYDLLGRRPQDAGVIANPG